MLAPMVIDALQQHRPREGRELISPQISHLGGESVMGSADHFFDHIFIRHRRGALNPRLQTQIDLPLHGERALQSGNVPLLFNRLHRDKLAHQVGEAAFAQAGDLRAEVLGVQDVIALLIDHLALVVGDIVVLEQLLAHIKIARLHLALGAFNAAGDDTRLNGLALGHFQAVHDGLDPIARKNAHQRIVQAQVKTR